MQTALKPCFWNVRKFAEVLTYSGFSGIHSVALCVRLNLRSVTYLMIPAKQGSNVKADSRLLHATVFLLEAALDRRSWDLTRVEPTLLVCSDQRSTWTSVMVRAPATVTGCCYSIERLQHVRWRFGNISSKVDVSIHVSHRSEVSIAHLARGFIDSYRCGRYALVPRNILTTHFI